MVQTHARWKPRTPERAQRRCDGDELAGAARLHRLPGSGCAGDSIETGPGRMINFRDTWPLSGVGSAPSVRAARLHTFFFLGSGGKETSKHLRITAQRSVALISEMPYHTTPPVDGTL